MVNITANLTDIFDPQTMGSYLWAAMPPQITDSLSFILTLAKVAGILFLIYLVFLIVQAIIKIRSALRIKSIEKTILEINDKLGILVNQNKNPKEIKTTKQHD